MKQSLVVKHKYKGKAVKTYRFHSPQCSIGSFRASGIHLLGDNIAGLVCLIDKTPKGWRVTDLGSEPEVKLDSKKFCEADLKSRSLLQIGDNILEIQISKEIRPIFSTQNTISEGGKNTYYVAKWRGKVIESSFEKSDVVALKADGVELGEFKISRKKQIDHERLAVPKEMRKPLASSFGAFFIFLLLFVGIPGLRQQEPAKPKDNVYTRMIYDSKILNERKKELQSSGARMLKGMGGSMQKQASFQKNVAPESKAVASLRQAQISSIIGKIAKQASKSALLVAKLAAMPTAEASIDGQKLNVLGQTRTTQVGAGKADILGGASGFKVAGIGTAGKGGGQGGYKKGSALGDGGVGKGNIAIDDTESIVEGGLDREVIAKVIREHLGQIRYCYDRQLASDSDLHGKVKVNFSIDPEGLVDTQSVGESTMGSAMIEECILRRIATWKFPKPKGGTRVLVSYPFLFKSVN